jgi:hypothetical protein
MRSLDHARRSLDRDQVTILSGTGFIERPRAAARAAEQLEYSRFDELLDLFKASIDARDVGDVKNVKNTVIGSRIAIPNEDLRQSSIR